MSRTRVVLVVLLAVLGGVLAVLLVRAGDRTPVVPGADALGGRRPPRAAGDGSRGAEERRAMTALRGWDLRRAAAYRAGDPARLLSLYTDGSVAGAADARLLRRYRARGLRVVGMRTQVLSVRMLGSGPNHLQVRLSDRLVGAVAVRGRQRQQLPRDAASVRVVALVRSPGGRWLVSSVGEQS